MRIPLSVLRVYARGPAADPRYAVARYPAEIDLDLDFGFGRGLCFGRTGRFRPVAASGPVPVRLLGTPDGGRAGPDVGIRCFGCCVFSASIFGGGGVFPETVFDTVFYAPLGFAGTQFGTECGFRRMVFLHRIPCSPGDRETGPDGVRSASFVFVPNRAGRTAASCGFAGRLPFVPALHGGVQCAAEAIAPPCRCRKRA